MLRISCVLNKAVLSIYNILDKLHISISDNHSE